MDMEIKNKAIDIIANDETHQWNYLAYGVTSINPDVAVNVLCWKLDYWDDIMSVDAEEIVAAAAEKIANMGLEFVDDGDKLRIKSNAA